MMKFSKVFGALVLLVICISMISFNQTCKASPLPGYLEKYIGKVQYLNDDENYVMIDRHMGTEWYMDISSIDVTSYNPPDYCIKANILTVDAESGEVQKTITHVWGYNYDYRDMFVGRNDRWHKIKKYDDLAHNRVVLPGGELAWWTCYQIPFYW